MVRPFEPLIREDEIKGDQTHGDRPSITFYFRDPAVCERVRAVMMKGRGMYADSRKLAQLALPGEVLPDVV